MSHVIGVDPSLTGCGVAHITDDQRVYTWVKGTPPLPDTACPADVSARITVIVKWLFDPDINLVNQGTRLAVIEGPALGAEFGMPHERAGLFWRIVHGFCHRGIPVGVLNPTTVKGYIAGKGNADKERVKSAVAAAWPKQGLRRVSDNQADAVALATAGVDWIGWPGPWLEGRRGAAWLKKAQWPERESVTA